MKLTETIYQVSGIPFGNNSNTFIVDAGEELVLIDVGYCYAQWETIGQNIARWGLSNKPISHAFLTHAHMDHIGNAHLCKGQGIKLVSGAGAARAIENSEESTLCNIFGRNLIPCKVDIIVNPGEVLTIGNTEIMVLDLSGHSEDAFGYQLRSGELECLFIGDFFSVLRASPEDEVEIELGWTGSPDYDRAKNLESFKRCLSLKPDAVFPGHLSVFLGDCAELLRAAYEKAVSEL